MSPLIKTDIREIPMEEVAAKAATLAMAGVGINKAVEMLSTEFSFQFTRTQIDRLKKKDTYMRVVKEYKDNIVKSAVAELREGVALLIPKVISALTVALEEGNITAVPHVLKVLGVGGEEPVQQAQNIQVILPGSTPTEREVKNEQ